MTNLTLLRCYFQYVRFSCTHQPLDLFRPLDACRPCCQKTCCQPDHRVEAVLGKWVKWGAISWCTHQATAAFVHCQYILHFSVCLHLSTQPVRQTPLQPLQTVAYDNSEIDSHISREVKLWRAWASRAYVCEVLCCDLENTLRRWVQDVSPRHNILSCSCFSSFMLS